MIYSTKSNNYSYFKSKTINILMQDGKKTKGEKIILKSFKNLQKSLNSKTLTVFHTAVVNSTSSFKINEQAVKKGKRKATKTIPSFILNDSLRITNALKQIKKVSMKRHSSKYFHKSLLLELISTADTKSQVIEQKNEIHRQILINKRYLAKFRW